jgi:hypothetical protein
MRKPRILKPFHYFVDANDVVLTVTANLFTHGRCSEIRGLAKGSYKKEDLGPRLAEKRKGIERLVRMNKEL